MPVTPRTIRSASATKIPAATWFYVGFCTDCVRDFGYLLFPLHDESANKFANGESKMISNNASGCSRTPWSSLTPVSKFLVRIFAGAPVWALTDFQKPPDELTDELLGAAWDRAGFREDELRANPEVVVGTIKKLVARQLRAN
jgi:hypothetical protein